MCRDGANNGQTNRLFIARGWYDCNQNGTFDEEEPHRQAYIAVVGADYEVKDICTTGVHNAHNVAVKIGPAIAGLTVHMELQKTSGQGSAVFTNNNMSAIDITADTNLVLRGIQYSTVLSNIEMRAVAHELGHATGLKDIYDEKDGTVLPDDLVKEIWLPRDWNSGYGPAYYQVSLKQKELVQRLLMYGYGSSTKADISRGRVHGLDTSASAGLQRVGIQDMDRTPTHW